MRMKMRMILRMRRSIISSIYIEAIKTVFNFFFSRRNFKHLKHKQKTSK